MARTTLDIDGSILNELKEIQKRDRKPLGQVVSELLSRALADRPALEPTTASRLEWISRPMKARLDLADKDAVYDALESDQHR